MAMTCFDPRRVARRGPPAVAALGRRADARVGGIVGKGRWQPPRLAAGSNARRRWDATGRE